MESIDQSITQWINGAAGSSPVLDSVMIGTSRYGVPIAILFTILQWWSRRERPHVRHACVAAGLSFLIGMGLNQLILLFVHRIRPYDAGLTHLIIRQSKDWSFPSDHATAMFAITAAFCFQGLVGRAWLLLAGSLLMCVSRVFVGAHYASDVLGGAATGIIAATLVRSIYWEGTRLDRLITGIL